MSTNPVKNMTHESRWMNSKMRDQKQVKTACLRLSFYVTFAFVHSTGWIVVQMVHYTIFKNVTEHYSYSVTHWTFQVRNAMKRTKPSSQKTNTLLVPLCGHFTLNMSRNVHGATYFTPCKKVPTGVFHHGIRLDRSPQNKNDWTCS